MSIEDPNKKDKDFSRIPFSKETGLNTDYANEYLLLTHLQTKDLVERIKKYPIKKYFERKSSEGTVTDSSTEQAIKEIDELVGEINQSADNEILTRERFIEITDRMNFLIYGRDMRDE